MLLGLIGRRAVGTPSSTPHSRPASSVEASPLGATDRSRAWGANAWRTDPAREERARLIDEIIGINPSATVEFLGDFEQINLEEYLAHLRSAQMPRGRNARWVRPCKDRGIACYDGAVV